MAVAGPDRMEAVLVRLKTERQQYHRVFLLNLSYSVRSTADAHTRHIQISLRVCGQEDRMINSKKKKKLNLHFWGAYLKMYRLDGV